MEIEKAIKRLGYTDLWFDCGIITKELLIKQFDEIQTSGDDNAEHYRHRAFIQYLDNKESFTNKEVESLLGLEDRGPDDCDLRQNRILSILWSNKLSDDQFQKIGKIPEIHDKAIDKIYTRFKVIRSLNSTGLTPDNLIIVIKSTDSFVHEYVLSHNDITIFHLNWLKEHGVTKKVRNIARQLSQSKKFKQKT
ncbi:MAG: hypothetical protein GY804_00805 [Alphaproteobacteria bacterium]|nr:hypothetical protein [Alphaproteobacteria bacterium]